MNYKHSALLASLVSALLISGCASDKPTTTVASTQTAAVPQSTTASASTKPASSTSSIQTPVATSKPIAAAVYFDYDKYAVKDQYAGVVRSNAEFLVKSNAAVELDGNADERGSREYNMALGQKRADAVKRALAVLGAKPDRIDTVSFGEDKPRATGHDEAAWAENRRVDFVPKAK